MTPGPLATNPIYARLTRSARPPSLLGTVQTAIMVCLFGLTGVVLTSDIQVRGAVSFDFDALYPANRTVLVVLPVVAVTAMLITIHDMPGEDFRLLRAASLPGRTAVVGYVAAALFRLRLLLAAFVALMPVMAAVDYVRYFNALTYTSAALLWPFVPGPGWDRLAGYGLSQGAVPSLIVSAGFIGWTVLGAFFGVWMAFEWRRAIPALLSLPVVIAPLVVILWLPVKLPVLPVLLVVVVLPWALLPLTLRLAARACERARLA